MVVDKYFHSRGKFGMPYGTRRKFYTSEFAVTPKKMARMLKQRMIDKYNIEFYVNDLELLYREAFGIIKDEIFKGKRVVIPDFGKFNLKYIRGRSFAAKIKEVTGNKLVYEKAASSPKLRPHFKFCSKIMAIGKSIPPDTFPYIKEATESRITKYKKQVGTTETMVEMAKTPNDPKDGILVNKETINKLAE